MTQVQSNYELSYSIENAMNIIIFGIYTECNADLIIAGDSPGSDLHEVSLFRRRESEGGGGGTGEAAARREGPLLLLPIPPKSKHLEPVGRRGLYQVRTSE